MSQPLRDFEGKHVVVTGGAGALGEAVVRALLERGAVVHVPSRGAETPKALAALERVEVATGVDLTDEPSAVSFFSSVPTLWASIHVAGGFAMAPVEDTPVAEFRRLMDMNATSCFLSCREAAKAMRATGAGGRIVNVAAGPAVRPTGGMLAYAASKSAVAAMTEHLAEELRGDGIWVNAVLPSIIDTPANRSAMPDADHDAWPKPAQLADTMVYLASPSNALTWGALVPVFGRG